MGFDDGAAAEAFGKSVLADRRLFDVLDMLGATVEAEIEGLLKKFGGAAEEELYAAEKLDERLPGLLLEVARDATVDDEVGEVVWEMDGMPVRVLERLLDMAG